jgi:hypothetical protein
MFIYRPFQFFIFLFLFFVAGGVLSSSRHVQKMAAGHGERLCSTLNVVALMCIDNIYIGRYGLTDLVYFDMGPFHFYCIYLFVVQKRKEKRKK